jgi:hypothetical protein
MTRPRLFPDRPKGARRLERNQRIVAMYQEGQIAEEIGEAVALSTRRVLQILEMSGITRRRRNTPSVTGRKPGPKRKHQGFNNRSARFTPDGEKASPEPTRTLYACPNPACGFRSADPHGHPQCQKEVAA